MLLFASKFIVAWWITLMSAVGVWLPIFYVRRNRDEPLVGAGAFARGKKACALMSTATTKWYLSLANCVSAGMLLTMALMHFFPESFETGASGVPPAPTSLCFWLLVGILIPAVLERSMKGGGGHSHGMTDSNDGEHSHGEAGGGSSGGGVSTSMLLIVLMCFHGMTEGLLLGFEDKVAALLSAAVPLSIHKFCDGLVIGVAMAKEAYMQSGEEAPCLPTADAEGTRTPMRFWRRLYQGPVGVWLVLTPITMICVVLFASTAGHSGGSAVVNQIHHAYDDVAVTQRPLVQPLSVTTTAANMADSISTLAAVQAIGSGSFIFIGISILNGEELKGLSANAALLVGVVLTGSLFLSTSGFH
jgi:zinc transporter ZupT